MSMRRRASVAPQGYCTARHQHRTLALAIEADGIQIVERLFQPARAALFEIAGQVDGHHAILATVQRQNVDIRAVLVNDAAILQLRIDHIELAVAGDCLSIAAIGRHAPQIVAATLVTEVIQTSVPPHGVAQ
jgi:hypothetical protein